MIRRQLIFTFGIAAALTTTGCLETRSTQKEQEEKQVLRKQVQNLAATTADVNQRFQDVDDELRKVSGRVEAVEAKLGQSQTNAQKSAQTVETRVQENDKVYREEFAKLTSEIERLNAKIEQLEEASKRQASSGGGSSGGSRSVFEEAESKFSQKNWKEAILDYQNYRNANPKGKQFATATYKIGVSFQEMGMTDEARAFYEEVIAKFPKSKDAKSAQTKLKSLKK